jgi:RNA polymerase sigma-70 factor (ECF subfamily)
MTTAPPRWTVPPTTPVLAQYASVRAIREGDAMADARQQAAVESGLKQLCLSLRGELRRFAVGRGVSQADVDDLLQDLFLRVERAPTGPIRAPRAYLYQTLNNLIHLRRRTEMRRVARDGAWIYHQADTPADPETVLLARDHLARIEDHLDSLPERTVQVLRQYRLDGMSQKAIASDLGISLSAVEKHLQRAYRALVEIRRTLSEERTPGVERNGGGDGPNC